MEKFLPIAQIVLSILLISTILLQHRGTGLGGAFASESNIYRSKRGIEKFLFNITIILAILFCITAIVTVIIR
ncbi:MAG: preprotein translocase subunit SecG [Candidatus Berkelbacteria bacterium]|nr:preprotein translocase subunit SecG [Candidatus Berkelbacteria bacterium]